MLKIFAGADPQACSRAAREWHRDQARGIRALPARACASGQRGAASRTSGAAPKSTLVVGIRYHRLMLALIDDFLAGGEGAELALPAAGDGRDQAATEAPAASS